MKRFYETVDVRAERDGFAVTLDGRSVKTPAKRLLALPSAQLAELVAAEWAVQQEEIEPETMRINRLATTAVDLMPDRRSGAIEQVADYARSDLLCYRAPHPRELKALQAASWDPPLAWLETTHGIRLEVAEGVMPQDQPAAAVGALADLVAQVADWPLVGIHAVTTATGSVVLGVMLEAGALDARGAGEAALVDERYQRQLWGNETEALEREARLLADLEAAERFVRALRPAPDTGRFY